MGIFMSKALFVGRFQPFHLGHLKAIEEILRKNEKVYIIIGSAQQNNTKENPFSVEERVGMIRKALEAKGITDFEISSVEDLHDDRLWTAAIKKAFEFDVVYSQNPWTLECFEKNGVKVKRHGLYNERKYHGENIRRRISGGGGWKELVPLEVFEYVKKIGGDERIEKLFDKGA